MYRESVFVRGRKVTRYIERHPALLELYKHIDNKIWIRFTGLMEKLLEEDKTIVEERESPDGYSEKTNHDVFRQTHRNIQIPPL